MKRLGPICVLLLIALAAWAIAAAGRHRWLTNRASGHQETRAVADAALIANALHDFAAIQPASSHWGFFLTNANASSLYSLLSNTNLSVRVLPPRPDWQAAGKLLDPWGRPFKIAVGSRRAVAGLARVSVKVWSVGPNGRDEAGSGDDISATVEIPLVGSVVGSVPEKSNSVESRRNQ